MQTPQQIIAREIGRDVTASRPPYPYDATCVTLVHLCIVVLAYGRSPRASWYVDDED